MKAVITLFLAVALSSLPAQAQLPDGLVASLKTDKQRADTLMHFALKHFYGSRFDSATYLLNKGIPYAEKTANNEFIAQYFLTLGNTYTLNNKPEEGLDALRSAGVYLAKAPVYALRWNGFAPLRRTRSAGSWKRYGIRRAHWHRPGGVETVTVFDIIIVPHDGSGQPLGQIKRPVKLQRPNNTPGTSCGLELPQGQSWRWELSMTTDGSFVSEPNKIHSPQGQDIEGFCCSGVSEPIGPCHGDPTGVAGKKRLHFATYYQIQSETFLFFNNGNFGRFTMEDSPVPLPSQSDFCGNGEGVVQPSLKQTSYNGTWTLKPFTYAANLNAPYLKDDTKLLEILTIGSSGTGYGNPSGVLHQLDCKIGSLVMIQLDREGRGQHLVKLYTPSSGPLWNAMD